MYSSVPRHLGAHELKLRLAVGGQADLWIAEQHGPGGFSRRCALKLLNEQRTRSVTARRGLLTEARLLGQCDHPNLTGMWTLGEDAGHLYFTMPLLWGRPLNVVMRRAAQTPYFGLPEVLWIGQELLRALEYLSTVSHPSSNRVGVLHHDVTPENIVVTYNGQVKLIDFGIATTTGEWPRGESGRPQGKLAYLSPERAFGLGALDHRSDLYSAGLVLYVMATGTEPLATADLRTVQRPNILPPDRITDVPRDLSRLIMQLLDPDPARRPGARDSIRLLANMLHRFAPAYDHATFQDTILATLVEERRKDDDLLSSLRARTDLIELPPDTDPTLGVDGALDGMNERTLPELASIPDRTLPELDVPGQRIDATMDLDLDDLSGDFP